MKLCGFEAGLDHPFFLIAGPCTAECEQLCLDVAGVMKEVCARLGVNPIRIYPAKTPNGNGVIAMRPLRMTAETVEGVATGQSVKTGCAQVPGATKPTTKPTKKTDKQCRTGAISK